MRNQNGFVGCLHRIEDKWWGKPIVAMVIAVAAPIIFFWMVFRGGGWVTGALITIMLILCVLEWWFGWV